MKKLDLTKIGFFNPGRLSDEEIERSFVARVPLFQYLFKKIVAESRNSIPQQYLIIGQRGMGKTSLLVRMAVELRKKPYSDDFIALTFPEEQYNIDRLSKFWLNCLDALANALDREKQTELTQQLDEEIANIAKIHHQVSDGVYEIFEKWIARINRRPVLLVDNMNLILHKISKTEQHQLRAILMKNNAPIVVSASASLIEEVVDYGAPFYDAFQIQYLKKLTFEESLDVLKNLAKITGKTDFEGIIHQNRGRLGALYQLTGGTPRTIAMLFPLIQDGFSEAIQTDLEALLDIVTPLYKARFEELPDQMQVVLDAIALHWAPMTIEQMRNVTQLENGQLSPQLKRLIEVGWLQKLDAFKSKGSVYELSERFFNIWYLMRRSNRRTKRELYCLSKFLETFYGDDIKHVAQNRLSNKNLTTNSIAIDLALADSIKDVKLSAQLRNKSHEELIELSKTDDSVLRNFDVPDEKIQEKIEKLWNDCVKDLFEKKYENCLLKLKQIEKFQLHNVIFYSFQAFIENELGEYQDSEKSYLKAIELDKNFATAWNNLGNLYQNHLGQYQESEKAYLKAIELDKSDDYPKYNLVFLYRDKLNRLEEAKTLFNTIPVSEELKDTHLLHQALFAYYDANAGIAKEFLLEALQLVKNGLPSNTQDDWWRAGAIAVKLGYGTHFLQTLAENGFDIILKPYYVAIQALMQPNPELFFNSIATEVREPAKKIMEIITKY